MPPLAEHHQCEPYEWQCANKRCIPESWQCDMEDDCDDDSDEDSAHCAGRTCPPGYFKCANGHCIPQIWKCDVDNDCGDYSDEPLQECCEFCVRVWERLRVAGRECRAPAVALWRAPSSLSPGMQRRAHTRPAAWTTPLGLKWRVPGLCPRDVSLQNMIKELTFLSRTFCFEPQRKLVRDSEGEWGTWTSCEVIFFFTFKPSKKMYQGTSSPIPPHSPPTVWPQHKQEVMTCWENRRSWSFYSEWTNDT